jgi:excisionase family DNA binding protein
MQILTSKYFDSHSSKLLPISEAAEEYGVPERTLRYWAEKNKIPTVRRGKLWKLVEGGLVKYIHIRELHRVQ